MLEQRVLLVAPRGAAATQPILDGESGRPLGCARWRPPPAAPWWRRLAPPVLAVHEEEDEPLVFTVHRGWGLWPRHEVRDADGRPVGSLRGGCLRDAGGRPVAELAAGEGKGERVFRGRGGRELARLTPGPEGLRLAFNPDVGDPFVRMLLLAAVLGDAS
jgi:hypothetical protein